jgi:hypothetical protein
MNSAHTRRVVAAGMIGNVLEWYDFAIYGYFATQIDAIAAVSHPNSLRNHDRAAAILSDSVAASG